MKLAFPRLYVNASDLAATLEWYERKLGMAVLRSMDAKDGGAVRWVGFQDEPLSGHVELRTRGRDVADVEYEPSPTDSYWKIGISVPDVDTARSRLLDGGVRVTPAVQFRDIGYLCHLSDPVGYSIELLQHDFDCNFLPERAASLSDPGLPLSQRASVGQITTRTSDAGGSVRFYRSVLGMKLLSRQRIPGAFDLYFLGCTDEDPPSEDVDAVEIREWLWRRPYTTLELQHYPNRPSARYGAADAATENGFGALGFLSDPARFEGLRSRASAMDVTGLYPEYGTSVLQIQDPDGTPVLVLKGE